VRGRLPTPTADKLLRGNPGHRPLNSCEPDAEPLTKLPTAPRYLRRAARKLYRVKGLQLIQRRILTNLDMELLARWAYWEDFRITASRKQNLDRLGTSSETNLLNAISMASKALKGIEAELGMGPASRSRIKIPNLKQKDLFGEFLNGLDADEPDDPRASAGGPADSVGGGGSRPPGDERLN
jgi:phage terminase small subunit